MSENNPAPGRRPDPISEALAFPFRNLLPLIRLALIPALITTVLVNILPRLFPPLARPLFPELAVERRDPAGLDLFSFVPDLIQSPISVFYYAFIVIFAVGIHRMIILGERPGWLIYRFGRHELAYTIVFFIVSASLWLPLLAFDQIFALPLLRENFQPEPEDIKQLVDTIYFINAIRTVYYVAWIVLVLKLLLIYPHAAVTGRLSFGTAWAAMKGHFWETISLLVVLGIILIAFSFTILVPLTWLIFPQLAEHAREGLWWIMIPIGATLIAIYIPFFAATVALISFLYRDLVMAKPKSES